MPTTTTFQHRSVLYWRTSTTIADQFMTNISTRPFQMLHQETSPSPLRNTFSSFVGFRVRCRFHKSILFTLMILVPRFLIGFFIIVGVSNDGDVVNGLLGLERVFEQSEDRRSNKIYTICKKAQTNLQSSNKKGTNKMVSWISKTKWNRKR